MFPLLPAELRLQIWSHSFLPRAVELHARRLHYADSDLHGGVAAWQSGSPNPVALAVNSEARAAAQSHYAVRLPLAPNRPCDRSGESIRDGDRVLYIDPGQDTVVLLGEALSIPRIKGLLACMADVPGPGLKRLALSARCFAHGGCGVSMRIYARTLFRGLEELVLFMYEHRVPPESWKGGAVELVDCSGEDYYRRFVLGRGSELRDGSAWMKVGERELKVMDLVFCD